MYKEFDLQCALLGLLLGLP